jgi:hypothetical protein
MGNTASFLWQIISSVIAFFLGAFFHTHNLAYDIAIFFCAILAGNILSWKLLSVLPSSAVKGTRTVAVIFLTVIALSFSFFTYFPPRVFLFRDPRTGGFGIITGGR